MACALFATALAQMLVPVIALIAGMHRSPISSNISAILGISILNGLFAALFVGSALLLGMLLGSNVPQPQAAG